MLTYKTFKGKEIESVILDLAQLRIIVFKDYPYLYEGTISHEQEYLSTYINSENSLLFSVWDNEKMVGATTCIPLIDETADVQEPFIKAGMNIESIFYFGESILLSEYRGLGIGNRFFEERENHARSFGVFETTCFCSVVRPDNHPMKPTNYQPHDIFWTKRGYKKDEDLQSQFDWLDINESQSTVKPMVYWVKNI
jgi:GNAT superfamily N-acetyltransferase